MLEESRPQGERTRRALDQKEKSLLRVLLGADQRADLNTLQVVDAGHAGTHGLLFLGANGTAGRFGREIGKATYNDDDGVLISISLSVDEDENLFELDFWRVDFQPIRKHPEAADLENVTTAG